MILKMYFRVRHEHDNNNADSATVFQNMHHQFRTFNRYLDIATALQTLKIHFRHDNNISDHATAFQTWHQSFGHGISTLDIASAVKTQDQIRICFTIDRISKQMKLTSVKAV